MRQIKFRVWDKVQKKMLYYDKDCSCPNMTLNGVLIEPRCGSNVSYIYNLMQFTGLLDKNGKEIYEGDIVKRNFHYGNDYGDSVGNAETETSTVEWGEHKGQQIVGFSFFPADDINKMKIIGNIYENPELLKADSVGDL